MKTIFLLTLTLLLNVAAAQRARGQHHHGKGRPVKVVHHHPNKKVVEVHRSPYRPRHVVVYHPAWGPNYAYQRRWVFFPRRNLYWDNWRNHWVYFNGTVWISQPACPPGVKEQEVRNDRQRELSEENDDVDDIYKNNSTHQKDTIH